MKLIEDQPGEKDEIEFELFGIIDRITGLKNTIIGFEDDDPENYEKLNIRIKNLENRVESLRENHELVEEEEEIQPNQIDQQTKILKFILTSLRSELNQSLENGAPEATINNQIAEIEKIEKLIQMTEKGEEVLKMEINGNIDKEKSVISIRYHSFNHKNGWCPYCKKDKSSKYLAVSHQLNIDDYERLLERGFVLDGSNLIVQEASEVCCIYRHIRTNVHNFKIRKCQKKAWNRWQRFMNGERGMLLEKKVENNIEEDGKLSLEEVEEGFEKVKERVEEVFKDILVEDDFDDVWSLLKLKADKKASGKAVVCDLLIKLFWKNQRNGGILKGEFKNLNEFLNTVKQDILSAISGSEVFESWEVSLTKKGYIKFIKKNQGENENKVEEEKETRIEYGFDLYEKKKRKLELRLSKAGFTKEKHELYSIYNTTIHKKEKPTEKSFSRFLCTQSLLYKHLKSPELEEIAEEEEGGSHLNNPKELRLGCYHLEMRLDGVLIGVLVHQYLHSGLVSGYFFYNPAFQHLSIGIVSAILEINLIKERSKYFPDHKYYYLATYIYGNKKVAYKTDFKPVELYCPITRNWVFLDDSTEEKLKEKKIRLAGEDVEHNNEDNFEEDLLGYLAQTISSMNPIMPREDIGEEKEPREFDFDKIEYIELDINPQNDAAFKWWIRKLISFSKIILTMGITSFKNSYWDVSNVRKGVKD